MLRKILHSFTNPKRPAAIVFNDEYIDSLLMYHTKARAKLLPDEYLFTKELLSALKSSGISLPLFYEIRGSLVRYKVGPYQIGGIENIGSVGKKCRLQALTDKKVNWYDIDGCQDALLHIPELVKYAKSLQSFHSKI